MKPLIALIVLLFSAGCGSGSAPVKHYPSVVDQSGNPVTNSPYPLPPAPPQGDYRP